MLHMKDSSTYNMLKDNKVLPLPHESIIYTYMKRAPTQGGKSLDEMHTREGLDVDTQHMTFSGLGSFDYSVLPEMTNQMYPKKQRCSEENAETFEDEADND